MLLLVGSILGAPPTFAAAAAACFSAYLFLLARDFALLLSFFLTGAAAAEGAAAAAEFCCPGAARGCAPWPPGWVGLAWPLLRLLVTVGPCTPSAGGVFSLIETDLSATWTLLFT